jgi:RecA-family ATPase
MHNTSIVLVLFNKLTTQLAVLNKAFQKHLCGKKVRQGSVVYIAAEGGLGVSERLEAFRLHHELGKYADIYVIPTNVCLCKNDSQHKELLAEMSGIKNVQLIVVDTLARAMGSGDENSTSDMGSLIKNCDTIRSETGAHIMVVHHSGKDETRGARGSSALKAAIDTEMQVVQSKGIISTKVQKQREGRTGGAIGFTLKEYEVARDEDDEPVISCSLVLSDEVRELKTLTGQAREARQVLLDLMIDKAVIRVPKKGMKAKKVIRIEDFRTDFRKAGIATTDNPDSIDKAFGRARKTLISKGYIAEWDGYIWILDEPDKTRQTL